MLPWSGRVAEPGVIGQIHQNVRAWPGPGRDPGKQGLVADQKLQLSVMRQGEEAVTAASREINRPDDGIGKWHERAKRHEFTKRNKPPLVIERLDLPVRPHQRCRIEKPPLPVKSRHAGDQPSVERQRFPRSCL